MMDQVSVTIKNENGRSLASLENNYTNEVEEMPRNGLPSTLQLSNALCLYKSRSIGTLLRSAHA